MFQVTKTNFIPCLVALAYILGFSYVTIDLKWFEIPHAWIWLGAIPAGLGMWIKGCSE